MERQQVCWCVDCVFGVDIVLRVVMNSATVVHQILQTEQLANALFVAL